MGDTNDFLDPVVFPRIHNLPLDFPFSEESYNFMDVIYCFR
jgi:hypothetical protein